MESLLWCSRADADVRAGGRAVDVFDAAEHEGIAVSDLRIGADSGGVRRIESGTGNDVGQKTYGGVVVACRVRLSCRISEEGIGTTECVRSTSENAEDRIVAARLIRLAGKISDESVLCAGRVRFSRTKTEKRVIEASRVD